MNRTKYTYDVRRKHTASLKDATSPGYLHPLDAKMKKYRKENDEKVYCIPLGIISLAVGLLFFCPGFYAAIKIGAYILIYRKYPHQIVYFAVFFILLIGTLLLFLAIKSFTGNLGNQKLSVPVLTIVSTFFMSLSILFFIMTYVFKNMPYSYATGKAIGGGFTIGAIGLFTAYRQKTASNKSMNRTKYTGDVR